MGIESLTSLQQPTMYPSTIASKNNEPATEEDFGDIDEDNLFSLGSLAPTNLQKLHQQEDYGFDAYLNFPMEMEKQISVDPASIKGITKVNNNHYKPKFISASLPCSTSSSPRSDSVLIKSMMKWKGHNQTSLFSRQRSTALHRSSLQQSTNLRKSKSCGEGRSCMPSDEFVDILSRRFSFQQQPSENGVQVLYECKDDDDDVKDCNKDQEYEVEKEEEEAEPHVEEESFKCGALCLFLPGLSKKKSAMPAIKMREDQVSVASRVVSLEKFECGSWSSSPVLHGDENSESIRSYFDLPLELIKSSANEANSPVKAAFLFDKDRKGVLKKCSSRSAPRKSHESSNRHVRFSTSAPMSYPPSPTSACITPRLLKAREDFNAFLEAQSV
ncbi:uncharacterized protein LOC120277023 isoform X2 [Dioscorea cayenensis subsp. rotundata]|uniref:Uncharacterized protein LOC120277023 isoform X2 n=1 Tax=Dioscorea cayennensis subsp. rotundata TaxID=55577 RepID=A0AB40CIG9_DIOCR|nr:uncharacterized protein LOC120277023 isoform X2 [Dioscorea cayenensis subsp. rotundata]